MSKYIVVRGGRVIDAAARCTVGADILIEGDTIREVGPSGLKAPDDGVVVDARERLLIPGLLNAHTHSHANIPRSVRDMWTLELALNTNPAYRGSQSVENKYLAAQLGAAELVSKGCTACYDLVFEYPEPSSDGLQAIAQAYADVGIRAVVAPLMASRSFYMSVPGLIDALPDDVREAYRGKAGFSPWERSLEIVEQTIREWRFDRDQVRPAVAPTIPTHCSDDFLVACQQLAREYDVGFQTHLAESKVQALAGMNYYDKTLTAHLADLGLLGPNFTAAHGVWLDDDDMLRLADAGASVAHNPASNMRYGTGMAAVRRMLERGLNVGLGTDSRSCSDNLNMFESMRLASFTSRVQGPDYKRWLTTDEAFTLATTNSAQAMGFDDKLGAIAAGYKADMVFLDLKNLNYVPLNDPVNQVVNAEDGTGVDSVMIGGRMVFDRGRLTTVDLDRLATDAEAAMERLRSVNGEAVELALRLEDVVGSFCVGLARGPYHVHRYCGHD